MRDSSLLADPSKQRTSALASTSTELQPVFELGGRFETRSLTGLATELFKDPAFVELCDKGLNGTLQRTKDGATAESRIQELAGMAKTSETEPLQDALLICSLSKRQDA